MCFQQRVPRLMAPFCKTVTRSPNLDAAEIWMIPGCRGPRISGLHPLDATTPPTGVTPECSPTFPCGRKSPRRGHRTLLGRAAWRLAPTGPLAGSGSGWRSRACALRCLAVSDPVNRTPSQEGSFRLGLPSALYTRVSRVPREGVTDTSDKLFRGCIQMAPPKASSPADEDCPVCCPAPPALPPGCVISVGRTLGPGLRGQSCRLPARTGAEGPRADGPQPGHEAEPRHGSPRLLLLPRGSARVGGIAVGLSGAGWRFQSAERKRRSHGIGRRARRIKTREMRSRNVFKMNKRVTARIKKEEG